MTTRTLLVLALSSWLAAPAFAQSTEGPAAEPVEDAAGAPAGAPQAEEPAAAPEAPLSEPSADATAPESAGAVPPEAAPAASSAAEPPAAEPLPGPQVAPAPQPAPMPAAALPPPSETGEILPEESSACALGELCIGPVLSLGLINPLGVGAHARYGEHLGFGIDYQFIPSLSMEDASAGWSLFTVEGRWYPFGGAFWLGGGFGYQSFSADGTAAAGGTIARIEGSIGVPAFKLGLGFMGKDGFIMGIDLGFLFPLGGTDVDFAVSGAGAGSAELAAMVDGVKKDIEDSADVAVNLIPFIPQLNLLRIGYLF